MKRMTVEMLLETGRIEQLAMLELFDLDLTDLGGDMYRFHAGTNELREAVVWRGHRYEPYPVQASNFSISGQGASNRPKMTFANLTGMITGINQAFDDLAGAVVTRRQMYVTHLDAENFASGNPKADPEQEVISRYVVERLISLDADYASYELALPAEMDGAVIPARVISTDVCPSCYRSSECSYSGPPVADDDDNPTTDPTKDKCGKRLSSCKLRFGDNGVLPFGGFPSAARLSR